MLLLTTKIDLVNSAILATPGVLAFFGVWRLHRKVRVPSGGTIGQTVDHTHTLAAGTSAVTSKILKQQNGEPHA